MNIAAELEKHAAEELEHAPIIAGQIDYLGGMPVAVPEPVKTSRNPEDMLRFDLDNENETIRHYRQRVRQCEGWASTPSRNTSGRSWCRSRIIRSPWRPPSEWKCRASAARNRLRR